MNNVDCIPSMVPTHIRPQTSACALRQECTRSVMCTSDPFAHLFRLYLNCVCLFSFFQQLRFVFRFSKHILSIFADETAKEICFLLEAQILFFSHFHYHSLGFSIVLFIREVTFCLLPFCVLEEKFHYLPTKF
uniref:Ovule protein n=1 Tax=Ascaris lumbricoides TaxID=6252 RepID=A0A0M3HU09_ASCLU